MVLPVDERDLGVDASESFRGGEPAESRANDDDSRFPTLTH
jgi:hypothetical protein